MYADPAKIRSHVIKVRLSDEEAALINALVAYTGEQKATLVREIALERALEIVSPDVRTYEAAFQAQVRS